MEITHKLKMNLEEEERLQSLEMPLGDVNTRRIELFLYANNKPWIIPEEATVVIRYKKPDGTVGEYDTLPNGTKAWTISENMLILLLAPQMLTVAGKVTVYACLYLEEQVAQTFGLEILVKAPVAGMRSVNSADYVYMTNVLRGPVTAREGLILTAGKVDDQGRVTEVGTVEAGTLVDENGSAVLYKGQSLTGDQKIQARANIEAASQAAVDYLVAKFAPEGIILYDEKTAEKYILYIRNGKLTMKKE